IKTLEQKVQKTGQTQIFMETPYRNAFIIETCLDTLNEQTRLCIACDINAPDEDIRQMRVVEWKKAIKGEYHKRPCIYLIGK
ncbi:MAG: SAM-dependent methyltransferase, partial [Saprospiraceae bacterium]